MKPIFATPDLFVAQTASGQSRKLFELVIPGRLPSWNDILGMEQWARYKFKRQLQVTFLSALRASANDCSTKTTSHQNSMLIAADTLDSYLETARQQRALKSASKRRQKANQSAHSSNALTLQ